MSRTTLSAGAARGLAVALVVAVTTALPLSTSTSQATTEAPEVRTVRGHLDDGTPYVLQVPGDWNAAKHAQGATVRIDLARVRDELRWAVTDVGPGFDVSLVRDGGLAGLHERLAALGGRLEVVSSPEGTTVSGVLPTES